MTIFVFAILLALILFLLFSPLKIYISLNDLTFNFRCKLAGILIFKLKRKLNDAKSTEEKVSAIDKQSLSFSEKFKLQYRLWKSIIELTNKYLTINFIKIKIEFGTSDAPSTAILSGVLWGAVYRILGILGSIIPIEKNDVDIVPEYNKETFSFNGKCIIEGRLVYIIIIILAYMIKNPKKKIRRKNDE